MSWSFWLYLAPWAPFTACLLFYGFGSPWWSSATGKAQMSLYASISGVLSLVLAVQLFDLPAEVRAALRVLTLGLITVAGIIQFTNILKLQHRRRNEPDGPRRRSTDRPRKAEL